MSRLAVSALMVYGLREAKRDLFSRRTPTPPPPPHPPQLKMDLFKLQYTYYLSWNTIHHDIYETILYGVSLAGIAVTIKRAIASPMYCGVKETELKERRQCLGTNTIMADHPVSVLITHNEKMRRWENEQYMKINWLTWLDWLIKPWIIWVTD